MIELAGGELLTDRRGAVQWIIFNRPQAKNALTWAMYDGLVPECEKVNTDRTIRAVVISGAGQTFAAGTDIAQFRHFHTLQHALDSDAHSNHVTYTVPSPRSPATPALAPP